MVRTHPGVQVQDYRQFFLSLTKSHLHQMTGNRTNASYATKSSRRTTDSQERVAAIKDGVIFADRHFARTRLGTEED